VGLKLNKFVEKLSAVRKKTHHRKITVSIGVSSYLADADSLEDLINHADIALYKAKARGRNLVVAYQDVGKVLPLRIVE
jgi:diguanylate cyclase (GGDEF)-like protein